MSTFRTLPVPDPFTLRHNARGKALIQGETEAVLALDGWFTAALAAKQLGIGVPRASLRLQAMECVGQLERRSVQKRCYESRWEYRRKQL
jgi:hypothetical protein